jgi:LysM repeat protein
MGPLVRLSSLRTGCRPALIAGLILLAVALAGAGGSAEASPHRQSASGLIEVVNELRASNGMAPLKVDPILMQVAQTQSDFNAATGELSHYGPSGQLTRDDAIDAGYGGGSTVFVSENIAVGRGLTSSGAVEMWTGDEPHLNTMLGEYYRDVGAGVGEDDGDMYFTLVTGYVAGGYSAGSTVPAAGAQPVFGPVAQLVTATPQADGSVVHTVEEGQTLWTIAAIYGIDLAQLLSLNSLTEDSFVHAGDRLTVRAAPTDTPSPAPTATVSPSPGPPTPIPPTPVPPSLKSEVAARLSAIEPRDLLGAGCLGVWLLAVIAGLVIASRRL